MHLHLYSLLPTRITFITSFSLSHIFTIRAKVYLGSWENFPRQAKTAVGQARAAFLTHVLAKTLISYQHDIVGFGREWSPTSFPFRELMFALVSIASGQAEFHSFPAQPCDPRSCSWLGCRLNHLQMSPGWFDEEWAGVRAPLLEFGSMSHRPSEPPGVSSSDTMYWHGGVLVSLVLTIDGRAITEAATHGLKQGRINFQIVVLSLFKVAFAKVSHDKNDEPLVKLSKAVPLSPLRAAYCVSTHPRERPELKAGTEVRRQHGELVIQSNCTGTARRLQKHFPGLAALVNFFDIAARRCAVSKTTGNLPTEIYARILEFVDYDTWTKCALMSTDFVTIVSASTGLMIRRGLRLVPS
ncbi:hypothetical protein FANTH_14881 [Fusarium anthophilum]|uniref:F-box domain-containing protein n=1 Tax=Fusarium anthophilum TaxID=48485 RepID=A0A8H4YF83_9HYPO|nr:hypothetical protein FANTH_14881 [Fusarium anthophilum]